jgi:hypothetical protein
VAMLFPSAPAAGMISLKTAMPCVRPPGACCCVNAAHRKIAVRKMKVAETIDIEFLQAERLQDFFAFHVRRPIREVMEVSGHNWRVPYSIFAGCFGIEVASARKNGRSTRVPDPMPDEWKHVSESRESAG